MYNHSLGMYNEAPLIYMIVSLHVCDFGGGHIAGHFLAVGEDFVC